MKTFVYVDGFNLYYRALRGKPYRWLNLKELVRRTLGDRNQIAVIKYYTARVSGKQDRDAPRRQQAYLDAIQTIPEVQIHYGRFLAKTIRRPLVKPQAGQPVFVEVHHNEEKGSDVNLAAHLLHDGWKNEYEVAVVISNDTDLCEPIRLVKEDLKKPVGIICPAASCAPQLRAVATFVRHLSRSRLSGSQFPDVLLRSDGHQVTRPDSW